MSRFLSVVYFALLSASLLPAQYMYPGMDQAHRNFASTSMFNSVVWVGGYHQSGSSLITSGSGVVVRNDTSGVVVLTAGHVSIHSNDVNFGTFKVTTRASIYTDSAPLVTANSWSTHPGYIDAGFGADIGYITLPAGSLPGITPAIVSSQYLPNDAHFSFSGYGRPGFIGSPLLEYDGVKRAGENINDFGSSVTSLAYYYYASFPNGLPLYMSATPGTSGGGMFRDDGALIGIATDGAFDLQFPQFRGIATAQYVDWIASIPVSEPHHVVFVMLALAICIHWFRARVFT